MSFSGGTAGEFRCKGSFPFRNLFNFLFFRMNLLFLALLSFAHADNMDRLKELLNSPSSDASKKEIKAIGAQMEEDYSKALQKYLASKKRGFFGKQKIRETFKEAAGDYSYFLRSSRRFKEADTVQGQIKVVMEEIEADKVTRANRGAKINIAANSSSVLWLLFGSGSPASMMLIAFLVSGCVIVGFRLLMYMVQ